VGAGFVESSSAQAFSSLVNVTDSIDPISLLAPRSAYLSTILSCIEVFLLVKPNFGARTFKRYLPPDLRISPDLTPVSACVMFLLEK
jgi:hypothetical protein